MRCLSPYFFSLFLSLFFLLPPLWAAGRGCCCCAARRARQTNSKYGNITGIGPGVRPDCSLARERGEGGLSEGMRGLLAAGEGVDVDAEGICLPPQCVVGSAVCGVDEASVEHSERWVKCGQSCSVLMNLSYFLPSH